jgi:hypothetical protein
MLGRFSSYKIGSELQKFGFWEEALEGLCKNAGETPIKSVMTIPDKNRITMAEGSIDEAIHQMLSSGQDYLFVRNAELLTGIISLSDIVGHICDAVRACRV